MNRLHLDFTLEDNQSRSEFVQKYLKDNEAQFTAHPLTQRELSTIADYILWGRNASGLNDVQEKRIQIATKHGNWDNTHPTESLDALIESPTFNESQLQLTSTHYTKPTTKFSRSAALRDCPEHMRPYFTDLFRRIDTLDLLIEYYELSHDKRTSIREPLLDKFSESEKLALREQSAQWTSYYYLKQRHELVELRREQYVLRDSFVSTIQLHNTTPAPQLESHVDWGAEIVVLPLGLKTKQTSLIFRDKDHLNPESYTGDELKWISDYYWAEKENGVYTFDFRDLECVYELFMAFFDIEDAGQMETIEGNSKYLMDTLNYYVELAELSELYQELLELKIRKMRNADIAYIINKEYGKNYTANYISTLFRQKIIPQINAAARIHEEIMGKIYFPEEFKVCSCCGRTYLRTSEFFIKKARSKDGLNSRCKKCDKQDRNEKKVIKLVQR